MNASETALLLPSTIAAPGPAAVPPPLPPDDQASDEGPRATARYDLARELGRGGLGVVFAAKDRELGRMVALKSVRADRNGAGPTARLVREAQITAQLDHPNVPAVHTIGVDAQGTPFFTMTFVRGRSLGQLLALRASDASVREALSATRLIRVFLQVASAVAYAHERGVLHRDLKPDNVMIGDFGEVRVMDWGIAKVIGAPEADDGAEVVVHGADVETEAGAMLGTVLYAAPEQLEGRTDIDARADVYALGALLYTMLAGRPPVIGTSRFDVAALVVAGAVTPIRRLVPVDRALAAVVHHALGTKREDRYPTVAAFIADVEALLDARPVSVLRESAPRRLGRIYMGRPARIARLKTIDVDLIAWSCFAGGISLALFATGDAPVLRWVLFAVSVVAGAVPLRALFRKPRADDPGAVISYAALTTASR
jgi:serine/threonine-protein kinase